MRLGLVILNNSSSLNNLTYLNQAQINPGENYSVFFQLVDLDQPLGSTAYPNAPPSRYMPISGAYMTATMNSYNNANVINKTPTNPFPADDRSIWSFTLNTCDTQRVGGVNLNITLVEGTKVSKAVGQGVIVVGPSSQFCC